MKYKEVRLEVPCEKREVFKLGASTGNQKLQVSLVYLQAELNINARSV